MGGYLQASISNYCIWYQCPRLSEVKQAIKEIKGGAWPFSAFLQFGACVGSVCSRQKPGRFADSAPPHQRIILSQRSRFSVSSESSGEAANHSPACAETLQPKTEKKNITWRDQGVLRSGPARTWACLGPGLERMGGPRRSLELRVALLCVNRLISSIRHLHL